MTPIVRRSAGEDTIVVFRIPLRFHQRLAPAVRAASKIGMLRLLLVERGNRLLGDVGHHVNRAVAEIDDLLRMSERPTRIDCRSRMAGIGSSRCIAVTHSESHTSVVDLSGEAAIALRLEFAVPTGLRHPHFDLDVRIGSRMRFYANAAK